MKKMYSLFHRSTLLALCLALLFSSSALAAPGDLDTAFSGDGKIIQRFGGTAHTARDVAVQADGKVVAVGEKYLSSGRDYAIARYTTAGALDKTFSGDGKQVVNLGPMDQAVAVAIQTDGKIVVAGQTCTADGSVCDVSLARLNTNGALDTTFGTGGKVTTDFASGDNGGFDMVLQGTKILVAGYLQNGGHYDAALYRYNPDGSLDTTFNGDGILSVNFGLEDFFNGVLVSSGKIYAVGGGQTADFTSSDFIVARINSNGTLDTSFSADGKVKTNLGGNDSALDLAVYSGKLIAAGFSGNNIAILRYTAAGALDTTFSGDGKVVTNLGLTAPRLYGVTLQNGKIVAAGRTDVTSGTTGDAMLVRYTAAGALDATFGSAGIVKTDWGGGDYYYSVLFSNSRFYAVGRSATAAGVDRFILARYLP